MKKLFFPGICVGLMFLFCSSKLLALDFAMAVPPDNQTFIFDHNTRVTSDTDSASKFYQTAAVYWLPDFLKDNLGLNVRSEETDKAGYGKKSCENYSGMTVSCPSPKISDGQKTVYGDLKCYKNCRCPKSFSFNDENCLASEGLKTAGSLCEGHYDKCVCQSEVKPGSGEKCDLYCRLDTSVCTAVSCKPTVVVKNGERCTEKCLSSGACTDKKCKDAVRLIYANDVCTEHCAEDESICTEKICKPSCVSDSSFPYGYSEIEDGCGGTCKVAYADNCHNRTSADCGASGCSRNYSDCASKCEVCNVATSPVCAGHMTGSLEKCTAYFKSKNIRTVPADNADFQNRITWRSSGLCDSWYGWCWNDSSRAGDATFVLLDNVTVDAVDVGIGYGWVNSLGTYINDSTTDIDLLNSCCGLTMRPTLTFTNATYFGMQKWCYLDHVDVKFMNYGQIYREQSRGNGLTSVNVINGHTVGF